MSKAMERDTQVMIVGLNELKRILRLGFASDVPLVIWSRPGVGKSEIMAAMATEIDFLFFDFRMSDKEPSDLAGIPVPSAGGKVQWLRPDGIPFDADVGDKKCIFLVDEIDRIDNVALYHVMLQMFQERRVNGQRLGKNVRIVACGNGDTDEHTYPMYDAIASRLCHIYLSAHDGASSDSWQMWASQHRVHTGVRYWMQENWGTVLTMDMERRFSNLAIANPRSVVNAGKMITQYFAMEPAKRAEYRDVMPALIGGCIGMKLGASLWSTAQMQQVVRLQEILGDPLNAHVPDDVASRYAIVYNLTDRIAISLADMDDAKAGDKRLADEGKEPYLAEGLRKQARDFAFKYFGAALAYVMRFDSGELAMAFATRVAALNDVVTTTPEYHAFMKDRNVFLDDFTKSVVDSGGKKRPTKKGSRKDRKKTA
jgi:hypothetical protein